MFTSTVALTGGSAQSPAFTPTTAGSYRWVATYDGDVNNASVSGACGDPTETRLVRQATPAIVTQASPDIVVGSGQLSDRATVTGVVNPIGPQTVTFRLYGPNNAACASPPVFTSTVSLMGGEAQSALFTPTTAGTFRWIATYDGDANNVPAAGSCGDPTETLRSDCATDVVATGSVGTNWCRARLPRRMGIGLGGHRRRADDGHASQDRLDAPAITRPRTDHGSTDDPRVGGRRVARSTCRRWPALLPGTRAGSGGIARSPEPGSCTA